MERRGSARKNVQIFNITSAKNSFPEFVNRALPQYFSAMAVMENRPIPSRPCLVER